MNAGVVATIRVLTMCAGLLLTVAGAIKIHEVHELLFDIAQYQMVSAGVAVVLAASLPWLELVVGVCILSRCCYLPALLMALLMFLVFATVQLSAIYRGLDIACGCFGTSKEVSFLSVAANGVLAVIMLLGVYLAPELRRDTRPIGSPENAVHG